MRTRLYDSSAEVNPVQKILLVVTGSEAEVCIDEISEKDDEGGNDNGHHGGGGGGGDGGGGIGNRNNFRALYAQSRALRREVQDARAEGQHFYARIEQQIRQLNANVQRVALQPARRAAPNNAPNNAPNDAPNNPANANNNALSRTLEICTYFGMSLSLELGGERPQSCSRLPSEDGANSPITDESCCLRLSSK